MLAHINGLTKNSKKRSRGPQISNVAKIESLYVLVDGLEASFALVNDAGQSLLFTNNRSNASITLSIDAFLYVSTVGRR